MKTMKSTVFFLLVIFSATIIITSCSKENETNKSVSENAKVSTYLKSFYSKNFELGKSVETKVKIAANPMARTTEVENLVITEVFVGSDTSARGYIITDKTTNDFRYFIDVDRVNYKLTSADIIVNDTKIFDNINTLDKYLITDQFDFIKIAEDLDNSTVSGKFWGSSLSWGACGPNTDGTEGCFQGQYSTYYVFWIATGPPKPTTITRACDC